MRTSSFSACVRVVSDQQRMVLRDIGRCSSGLSYSHASGQDQIGMPQISDETWGTASKVNGAQATMDDGLFLEPHSLQIPPHQNWRLRCPYQ
jgi:hypothetical protein